MRFPAVDAFWKLLKGLGTGNCDATYQPVLYDKPGHKHDFRNIDLELAKALKYDLL